MMSGRLLQTQRLQQLRVEGEKALGLTWAGESGFVARASALRAAGWLPEHSDAVGAALGSGLRVRQPGVMHISHNATYRRRP